MCGCCVAYQVCRLLLLLLLVWSAWPARACSNCCCTEMELMLMCVQAPVPRGSNHKLLDVVFRQPQTAPAVH
jgi:hypothetical protein